MGARPLVRGREKICDITLSDARLYDGFSDTYERSLNSSCMVATSDNELSGLHAGGRPVMKVRGIAVGKGG